MHPDGSNSQQGDMMPNDVHTNRHGSRLLGDDASWSEGKAPSGSSHGPPGFSGGDDAQARGEALRSMGALSAPPPPGFNPGPGDRSRMHPDLWSDQGGNNRDHRGRESDNGYKSSSLSQGGDGRTSSFSNLAAALGTGLAESMEDATQGELKAGQLLTDSFFLNPKHDLSFARQSRHAAGRLLGTSPSKDAFGPSHKSPDPGSLFTPMNTGQKNFPKKVGGGQSSLLSDMNRQRAGADSESGLSAAFSNDSEELFRSTVNQPRSTPAHSNYHGRDEGRSRFPASKDIGMTVMEPSDSQGRSNQFGGLLSSQQPPQRNNDGLERDMQNLWSGRSNDPPLPSKHSDQSVGNTSSNGDALSYEEELRPFCWDTRHHDTSRTLAILHALNVPANDIRATCEAFGVVESVRSDFVDRGVFFVSYFDMRCARYAAMELQLRLQRLDDRSGDRILVQYCVPLNSSSQNDESLVVLTDIPREMDVENLAAMLSSYGAVRSLKNLGGNYGGSSFVVEYHDVQDAKQAVLELESTQPWGPDVLVEPGTRNPSDRKRGRTLLALIGRWRHGGNAPSSSRQRPPDRRGVESGMYPPGVDSRRVGHRPPSPNPPQGRYPPGSYVVHHDARYDRGHPEPAPQLVLGPDGRYTYVVVDHSPYPPSYGAPPPQERVAHSAHGTYVTHVHPSSNPPRGQQQYWAPPISSSHQGHHAAPQGSATAGSYPEVDEARRYPSGSQSVPYYGGARSTGSSHRTGVPQPSSASASDDKDNRHLMLDLDAVEAGRDSRTSLMVRNIPNKYTQQMLLSEFAENGHGPGVIDFFYLPIDFKNRCNRGYAFINFVDYRDILPFHRRYYGQHWRTFNSDKICDITYARIQGKSAMLKRFENSALMEKDDEYKPLVFVSHGTDKGTRLPFPDPSNNP